MLTEPEYDRLPGVLRRIVDADRRLAPVRQALRAPVVAIGILSGAHRDFEHRRALTVEAEKLYGHRLVGAGPATA